MVSASEGQRSAKTDGVSAKVSHFASGGGSVQGSQERFRSRLREGGGGAANKERRLPVLVGDSGKAEAALGPPAEGQAVLNRI